MKIFKYILSVSVLTSMVLAACNKDVPDPVPLTRPEPTGSTIGDIINTDTTYSFLKAAITKADEGLAVGSRLIDGLSYKYNVYTAFAPNNAAMRASGIPSDLYFSTLPVATVRSIVQYHFLPGQKLNAARIPTSFPNVEMPTLFTVPAPNTVPFVKFTSFPSKRGSQVYINNIPCAPGDKILANGVMHNPYRLVAPASLPIWNVLLADTSMSYLRTAIARGDSGQTGLGAIQNVLATAYGPNITLFAPNNNAFRALLTFMGLPSGDPAIINKLPVTTVRGIVVYHALGVRAFSPNLPTTPTPLPTLLSAGLPGAPPVTVDASVPSIKGNKNATASKIIKADRTSTNGVIHDIDQVLLPL